MKLGLFDSFLLVAAIVFLGLAVFVAWWGLRKGGPVRAATIAYRAARRTPIEGPEIQPALTPFEAAVEMRSDVYSYRKRIPHLSFPGGVSLHNACIALYHKGYRLRGEQPAPLEVVMPAEDGGTYDYGSYNEGHKHGWNDCLAEVARLNGGEACQD